MDICSDAYATAFDSLVELLHACLSASMPLEASVAMAVRQAEKHLSDAEVICAEAPETAIREYIRTGNLEAIRKNEEQR